MPVITLPNGDQKSFDSPVSIADVAEAIGPGLAKAALAGVVDDVIMDTSTVLEQDCTLAIVTSKDEEGLEIIRHSSAHLLAQAVKRLFPSAQVTIGPVIENGFYYDFAFERSFTPEDIEKIEQEMKKIVKEGLAVSRQSMPRNQAITFFEKIGEVYKAEIIRDIPEDEILTLYTQGEFTDLCRGPHVPNTNLLKAFKLTKLAGAYWRGSSDNEMLQRIYGTAWPTKEELKDYLHRLEEAEKRDHRKLAKQMDLFHLQDEAPGMIFWHDKGWTIYQTVVDYIRKTLKAHDYQEVHTPQMVDRSLWQKSGHWDKFGDLIFATEAESRQYAIKPMNCPCHIQIYNHGLKSYRDLPLRMAEFGSCHRNEPSGTLHGMMRVRNFTQDDAHIFCTEDQIQQEVTGFIDLLFKVYKHFGFEDIKINLSTRPEKRVGSDEIWDKAEEALQQALDNKKLDWTLDPGEGAFYGPKIDFSLRDSIGRTWQCGTIQIDFSMPGRLDAEYVTEDGSRKTPVMLHRAILGSLERFIGVLIEHHAGKFPLWLAPVQAVVMNITDNQADYVETISKQLNLNGFRVNTDLRNEKIGFKIREHTLQRVPYLLIVGDKEMAENTVSVRTLQGENLGSMSQEALIGQLKQDLDEET